MCGRTTFRQTATSPASTPGTRRGSPTSPFPQSGRRHRSLTFGSIPSSPSPSQRQRQLWVIAAVHQRRRRLRHSVVLLFIPQRLWLRRAVTPVLGLVRTNEPLPVASAVLVARQRRRRPRPRRKRGGSAGRRRRSCWCCRVCPAAASPVLHGYDASALSAPSSEHFTSTYGIVVCHCTKQSLPIPQSESR
eukprot:COSAG05_NODE_2298_length_3258_cov_4.475467_3_plen_190_part_00